jgi:hypothetical protein
MKKTNEKILKYLDGLLSSKERIEFEKEIQSSEEFQNELNDYNELFRIIEMEKTKTINQEYAESILPQFRRVNKSKNSIRHFPRYAFGVSLFIILIMSSFLIFRSGQDQQSEVVGSYLNLNDTERLVVQLSSSDMISSYDEKQLLILDSAYFSYYSQEISGSENAAENLIAINDIDYSELENILSEEEIDFVYNEIINKEFF